MHTFVHTQKISQKGLKSVFTYMLFATNRQGFIKNSFNLRLCIFDNIGININFNTKTYKDIGGGYICHG